MSWLYTLVCLGAPTHSPILRRLFCQTTHCTPQKHLTHFNISVEAKDLHTLEDKLIILFLLSQICSLPCTALCGGIKGCPTALFPHARNARILLLLLIPGQVCALCTSWTNKCFLARRLKNCVASFCSNDRCCALTYSN